MAILRVMTGSSDREVARICHHLQHLAGNYRTTHTEQMGENAGQTWIFVPHDFSRGKGVIEQHWGAADTQPRSTHPTM